MTISRPYCPTCGKHYDWLDVQAAHCVPCREREIQVLMDKVKQTMKEALS